MNILVSHLLVWLTLSLPRHVFPRGRVQKRRVACSVGRQARWEARTPLTLCAEQCSRRRCACAEQSRRSASSFSSACSFCPIPAAPPTLSAFLSPFCFPGRSHFLP
eukprot:1701508-Rhodomonas_salina.1